MKFHFDESGDFRVPMAQSDHAVGIVVGIVIPENREESTLLEFEEFVRSLPPSAFRDGEPKGHLLDEAGKRNFVEFICDCDEILLCPAMLDLTTIAGRKDVDIRQSNVAKLQTLCESCKHQELREQLNLLIRQVGNLSVEQCLRLATWARCIMRSLQDSVIRYSGELFYGSWNGMRFEIDPVQPKPGSREEQVFATLLLGWVCAWSINDPFTTIEELHNDQHPFVQNYICAEGIDIGKIIRGNLCFPLSHTSKGLQIADMAASIVADAVRGVASAVALQNYGLMMTRSIGRTPDAPGHFSLVPSDARDRQRRFYGLYESIEAAKQSL